MSDLGVISLLLLLLLQHTGEVRARHMRRHGSAGHAGEYGGRYGRRHGGRVRVLVWVWVLMLVYE